jgi:hypothetical protein
MLTVISLSRLVPQQWHLDCSALDSVPYMDEFVL